MGQGSPQKIISFEFNDKAKKLSYILKAGDIDYLIEKLENKNVAVKKLSRQFNIDTDKRESIARILFFIVVYLHIYINIYFGELL